MQEDLKYWIWLSSIPKIGPKRSAQLVEYFGHPERIWRASELELAKAPFMAGWMLGQIRNQEIRDTTYRHMEALERNKIKAVAINDPKYHGYLKNIHDPPVVLYMKGDMEVEENAVGIVGSRLATPYGLKVAENLSCELAACGITVVSGMARGVDSYAHAGALRAGGRTIAVLGCGLDIAYPIENKNLMEKISKNGAVLSEYVPGTPPMAQNFPARNRIISGLSLGVVIIEAGEKSGSLITADFALEQGREVFSVPGNVNSSKSRGTNKLIREGAKIVTCIEDILEELNVIKNVNTNIQRGSKNLRENTLPKGLDDEEMKVAKCLLDEPVHIDMLAKKSSLTVQEVSSILIMMELKGIVEQLPGKIFKLRE